MGEGVQSVSKDLLHREVRLPRPTLPTWLRIPPVRNRWVAWLIVAATSVLSAAFFVWAKIIWAPLRDMLPTFLGACTRLKASGLGPTKDDWVCHANLPSLIRLVSAESLSVAAGCALACVILVVAGRRAGAFLPLVGAFALYPWGLLSPTADPLGWNVGSKTDLAYGVVLLLVAAPALVLVIVRRYPRPERTVAHAGSMLVSAVFCAAGAFLVLLPFGHTLHRLWVEAGWWGLPTKLMYLPAASMLLLGAALSTERKWWPWSLALVALLQSGGFAAVRSSVDPYEPAWLQPFGAVLPLFAIGFCFSFWRPLAEYLTRRRSGAYTSRPAATVKERTRRSFRPVVALNALAASVLVISMIAAESDGLSIEVQTPLATYLGERNQANDLRTKLDLRQALADMDAYYARHGTYGGFTAAVGSKVDPSLAWHDGAFKMPTTNAGGQYNPSAPPSLVMAILDADAGLARVVAGSPSGAAFCIQNRTGSAVTYGVGAAQSPNQDPWAQAIADCGKTPWTEAAVPPPTQFSCVPEDSSFLICRMVQVLIHNIMRTTNPNNPPPSSPTPQASPSPSATGG